MVTTIKNLSEDMFTDVQIFEMRYPIDIPIQTCTHHCITITTNGVKVRDVLVSTEPESGECRNYSLYGRFFACEFDNIVLTREDTGTFFNDLDKTIIRCD